MNVTNSPDPGTPEHQRSPVKSFGGSPRPSTPELLDLDLDLSPSRTKKESSRPKTPKISPSKRSRSALVRPPTPKKVLSPTRFASRPTSPKPELSPSKISKSKSQPTSPIEASPTKRFSISPGHSPKKLSRSSSRTSPKLTPSPSKDSPQSTTPLLIGQSRVKKHLKRFSSLPATPLPATSPAKSPCTPEISITPTDLPGPSTALKDLPGPLAVLKDMPELSTVSDVLLEDLPEELPQNIPEELPEKLTKELSEELAEKLPAQLLEALPEELPQKIPKELPEKLAEELSEELADKLPELLLKALPEVLLQKIPKELHEKLAEELSKELVEKLPVKIAEKLPVELLKELLEESAPDPVTEEIIQASTARKDLPGSSIAPKDQPGPSTAPKDQPGPSKATKDLPGPSTAPDVLPEELPEELPQKLPEKLAEELAVQLPEELLEGPTPDPATAEIIPNKETVIEITLNNKTLGIEILGGSDTFIKGPAAVILEVFEEGAAGRDGRLKVGDQIRECNGIVIHEEMVNLRINLSIKLKAEKITMTVYRPDPLQFEEIEVEVKKKRGKPFGINCTHLIRGPGVYINDFLSGSAAEKNGKLQKGDFVVKVGNKDVTNLNPIEVATVLRLCENKSIIKVKRFKIIPWEIPSEKMPKKLTFCTAEPVKTIRWPPI